MLYLESLRLPSEMDETAYILNSQKLLETCIDYDNTYPFKIFPFKHLERIDFEPITIFCGGNGSGKSTLLNIITEKLGIKRTAPYNTTPVFEDYLSLTKAELSYRESIPRGSEFIASDDVFDTLLTRRSYNDMIAEKRSRIYEEYKELRDPTKPPYLFKSLDDDDYSEFMRHSDARRLSRSKFVNKRMQSHEKRGRSNGEEAFAVFTGKIDENALYLLDEPENSLSPILQKRLYSYLADAVRFYGCQLIISTHSPFLLALPDAKIYDLDRDPVRISDWTEINTVREYYDFFMERIDDFE